ncbi:MAG: hypothetical protein NVSMB19_24060 [Vulcanimicrobiaceae bacterium]
MSRFDVRPGDRRNRDDSSRGRLTLRDARTTVNRHRKDQRSDESRSRRKHALRSPRDGRCRAFDFAPDARDRTEK